MRYRLPETLISIIFIQIADIPQNRAKDELFFLNTLHKVSTYNLKKINKFLEISGKIRINFQKFPNSLP